MATTGYAGLTASVGTGSKNFNMQMNDSSGQTVITVREGKVIRGGVLQDATAEATITEIINTGSMTDTSIQFQEVTADSPGANRYHLIVVDSSNVVKIRQSAGVDKVADLNDGDIPIAVLRMQRGEAKATRHIQYLTSSETTGTGITSADAIAAVEGEPTLDLTGDVTIAAGKDLTVDTNTLHVDSTNNRVGIVTNSPTTALEVKGDTTISRSVDLGQTRTLSIEGARNATGTDYARIDLKNYDSHGPTSYIGARISAVNDADGVDDGTLTFSTNNANAGITERMRIDDEGNVGIGTNSPDTELHIAGDDLKIVSATNAKPKISLENTTATASASTPPQIEFKRSGTPAQSGDLGMIKFVGKDSDDDSEHEYVRIFADMQDETETTEDGRLIFNIGRGSHQSNSVSNTEMLRLSGGEGVIFNQPKNNVDFEIRGDTNDNLFFADAGNERVGILNGSPSATLDVTGTIASDTSVTAPEVTGTASLTTQGLMFQVPETLDQTTSQPVMSGINSIVYVFDISNAPSATPPGNSNIVELPDPNTVANAVFTIRNVGSNPIDINVQGSQPIDGGLTTHALVSVANTITLPIGQHVTVQAVTDSVAPLVTGYYIIGN